MKKTLIVAAAATSVAIASTAAFAHRTAQTPPAKPDFSKTLFDKLQRDAR